MVYFLVKTSIISRRKDYNGYYQTISGATRGKTIAGQNVFVYLGLLEYDLLQSPK